MRHKRCAKKKKFMELTNKCSGRSTRKLDHVVQIDICCLT